MDGTAEPIAIKQANLRILIDSPSVADSEHKFSCLECHVPMQLGRLEHACANCDYYFPFYRLVESNDEKWLKQAQALITKLPESHESLVPFVVGNVVHFTKPAQLAMQEKALQANTEPHISECEDIEVWRLREATAMFHLGIVVVQQELGAVCDGRSSASPCFAYPGAQSETPEQKPPADNIKEICSRLENGSCKISSLQCAAQMMADAYLADEKCVISSQDLYFTLMHLYCVISKCEKFKFTSLIIKFIMSRATSIFDRPTEFLSNYPGLKAAPAQILDQLIAVGSREHILDQSVARLFFHRSLNHLQSGCTDLSGADVDSAIRLYSDPAYHSARASLIMMKGIRSHEEYEAMAGHLEIANKASSPDNRHLHLNCYHLCVILKEHGHDLLGKAATMYKQGVTAAKRNSYLYGKVRAISRMSTSEMAIHFEQIAHWYFGTEEAIQQFYKDKQRISINELKQSERLLTLPEARANMILQAIMRMNDAIPLGQQQQSTDSSQLGVNVYSSQSEQQGDQKTFEVLECCICLDDLNRPITLGCGHQCCVDCLDELIKELDPNQEVKCPTCRTTADKEVLASEIAARKKAQNAAHIRHEESNQRHVETQSPNSKMSSLTCQV